MYILIMDEQSLFLAENEHESGKLMAISLQLLGLKQGRTTPLSFDLFGN